jgi:EAL domain-containing protein (putative c-di-GMP-specific phosphodiesterase class I)
MLHDADQADRVFADLTRAEVGLTPDNFGTGYALMSFLRRSPVTALKIHRAYVAGADAVDEAICRAVMAFPVGSACGYSVPGWTLWHNETG